jgi:hypothetical protein
LQLRQDEADSFVRSDWLKGVPLSRTQKGTLIIISRKTLSKRKGESLSAEDLHKKQRQSYKAGFVHATKSFSSALQVAGPAILGAASPSMAAYSGVQRIFNSAIANSPRTGITQGPKLPSLKAGWHNVQKDSSASC